MQDGNAPTSISRSPMPWARRVSILMMCLYGLILFKIFLTMMKSGVKAPSVLTNSTFETGYFLTAPIIFAVFVALWMIPIFTYSFIIIGMLPKHMATSLAFREDSLKHTVKFAILSAASTGILAFPATTETLPAMLVARYGQSGIIAVTVEKTGNAGFGVGQCASGIILHWPDGWSERICAPLRMYSDLRDGEVMEQRYTRWHDLAVIGPVRQREGPQD